MLPNATILCVFLTLLPTYALAADNSASKPWYTGLTPILLLVLAVIIVVWRLPRAKEEFQGQLGYLTVKGYRFRRAINWVFLGATYAFLYWGRYNLNPAIKTIGGAAMVSDFNWIFSVGTIVYGVSFVLNGPLTDRFGGRFSILTGALGACVANILMGVACWMAYTSRIEHRLLFWALVVLYPVNMYFQSFGAVAIVKCNAAWFHVRERGVFGAIFGILIALGIYFAFDWSYVILNGWKLPVQWAFFFPAGALLIAYIADLIAVRNRPSDAGFSDFNTSDATSGQAHGPSDNPLMVFKKMIKNPVIMIIAGIEFCSGFLRQAMMQQYPLYAKATGAAELFVYQNWGMMLCVAGILGGVFAGFLSDHIFGSRRGPVATLLYIGLLAGSIMMCFMIGHPQLGVLVVFMSLCVIGVHGMLSGTASMDFGGTKNVGVAVGLIDGFVYLGTGLQSLLYANILPEGGAAAANPANWSSWPVAMIPLASIGLLLAFTIRHAKPKTS